MKPHKPPYTRRQFVHDVSLAMFSINSLAALGACVDNTNAQKEKKMSEQKAKGKLGIALVGLGGYSNGQLTPALQETQYCYLAGIVTGTPPASCLSSRQPPAPEKPFSATSFFILPNRFSCPIRIISILCGSKCRR